MQDGELSKFVGINTNKNGASVHLEAEHSQFVRGVTMDGHGKLNYLRYPTTKTQLEQAQSIFRDFEYYRSLCQSPKLLDEALDMIYIKGLGPKAYDETSPEKINQGLMQNAPSGSVR